MAQTLLDYFLRSSGVSTDTRTVKPGELFFALKGPNFNGNLYAHQALEAGASLAIVDQEDLRDRDGYFWVPDTLEALQTLARDYRRTWDCPVVALTGSNGKTTTKELLAAALAKEYTVSFTQGNLNNHIGVPLTILRTPRSSEIVVIEMGANHQREIAGLCKIAEPTHGFITNIGRAHLEGFGGIEGVRIGKGELFDYLGSHKGCAFVNINDPEVFALSKRVDRVLRYSTRLNGEAHQAAQVHNLIEVVLVQEWPTVSFQLCINEETTLGKSHLPGIYNFQNIAQAAAVASYFKVSAQNICDAVNEYVPANLRSEVRTWNNSSVLFDAYNANPDSMLAAISWLSSREEPNKIAVLGELAELGAYAKTAHEEIVNAAKGISGIQLATIGQAYKSIETSASQRTHFETLADLKTWLLAQTGSPDVVVLVKGSRSNQLEQVLS